MLKRFRFASALLATVLPLLAVAQPYPNHPAKIIVGFAPGGGTDVVARLIAQKLQESMGQPFVVENRAGATGTIGADIVAKSAPDGYTILMGHVNSNAIAPNLFKSLPYDAVADFQPVTYVGYVPNILAVNPGVPVKNVAELIAAAKAEPNKFSHASSGVGSTQHLAGEMFQILTGTKLVHIPYQGSGQAITDLLSGQVAMNFDTMLPVLPHVQAGKLKAFAISTPQLGGGSPQDFEVFLKAELAKYARLVKEAKVSID